MIRLWRRIKYGDTNKQPKYISKKDKWLYKNKWYTNTAMYKLLGLKEKQYSYELRNKDGNYDYYTTNNFNSVIEAVYPDPFKIRFPHPEEYDANENRILNTLIYNALKDYSNEVKEHIRKFQDKYIKK